MNIKIGPYQLDNPLVLAPMSGITDRPYRDICRSYGAAITPSEMIASAKNLQQTRKSSQRYVENDEPAPRVVQIVGTEPDIMAQAAQLQAQQGANIIDINMGCPAKKVCNTAAGSALMRQPKHVNTILSAVVNAVSLPVTLKIRTGWQDNKKNALEIAQIAEDCGVQALTIHGRTRQAGYSGHAEYETIRHVNQHSNLPVIANGDIRDINDIRFIQDYTGCEAVMLGRITHGQPWKFSELQQQLAQGEIIHKISLEEKITTCIRHIIAIHRHYGDVQGVRIARKHIAWYLMNLLGSNSKTATRQVIRETTPDTQLQALCRLLHCTLDNIIPDKCHFSVTDTLNQGMRQYFNESTYVTRGTDNQTGIRAC